MMSGTTPRTCRWRITSTRPGKRSELVQFPNGVVIPKKDIGEIDPTYPYAHDPYPHGLVGEDVRQCGAHQDRWLGSSTSP